MKTSSLSHNEKRQRVQAGLLIIPAAFWLVVFFALPLIVVLLYSFLTPSAIYQAAAPFTFDNYLRLTGPTYTLVLLRSLESGLITTFLCLIIGYPLAYFIATRPARRRNIYLLLVIVPFWTNFLVRTYAIAFIMDDSGLINSILINYLHLIDTPIHMMYTPFAVY